MRLRSRWLAALLAAEVVSTTGSAMTALALPWFVLVTTGSAARTGVVVAAELAGVALFGLPGGTLLQRLGARRTMMLCDAARGPLLALVPALHWAGLLHFWLLLAIVFVAGAFFPPYFGAQRVVLPELLGEDQALVTRANAFLQGATRVTMLLGPAIAGLLIGVVGAPALLVVDAATFFTSLALVGLFVPRRGADAPAEDGGGLLAGLRFLLRDPLLRVWSAGMVVIDSSWQALFLAFPVLAYSHFGRDAKVAGWLFAAFGLGALVGNGLAYRLSSRDPLLVTSAGMMVESLPLWLLALSLPVAGYASVLLAAGVVNGLVNPALHATYTLRTPVSVRAKASTAVLTVSSIGGPLAVLGAGPALDAWGSAPVFLAVAAVQTIARLGIGLVGLRQRGAARARPLTA
ncbi:MAG TPA: MFS transporter [Gaiellaceae bacterium]